MRRLWPVIVVGAVVLAGCGGDDDVAIPATVASSTSTSVPATTTPATIPITVASTLPVTTTTTAAPVPTTVPIPVSTSAPVVGACPAVDVPASRIETGSKPIDADADGTDDTVTTYAVGDSPAAGDWHLWVELAAGGGADIALPDDPAPGQVKVLGGVYIGSDVEPGPDGMRPAIFVTTGAGASATIVTLFRLDGCSLVAMGNGMFTVGAGVTHAENLRCDGVAGTSVLAYDQIEAVGDGATFSITETGYTRDGNDLTVYGAGPQTSTQSGFPDVATLIDCPNVDHP